VQDDRALEQIKPGASAEQVLLDHRGDEVGHLEVRLALVVGQVSGSFSFGSVAIDTASASSDAFIARLDGTGAVRWVTTGSGAGRAYGNEVALDAAGNVLAIGVFRSQITFGTRTLSAPAGLTNDQVFVTKLDGHEIRQRVILQRGGYRFGGVMKGYIRRMFGDEVVDRHLAMKREADPAMILNRNVIF
jgi:hypothetical protein